MKKATPHGCLISIILIFLGAATWSCSTTKHVPADEFLLDKVTIDIDNDTIKTEQLINFLRQQPNHKVLGFLKLQLATYNLSGLDSTKWYNRWLQSIGQPPVIYDHDLTEKSRKQLRQALINRGYMDVMVAIDTTIAPNDRKINVRYNITTGKPHIISSLRFNIPDTTVARIVLADSAMLPIKSGMPFDRNILDETRGDISQLLRNNGYFSFNKDLISFIADTVSGSKHVALTLNIRPPMIAGSDSLRYASYRVRKVYFVTDFNPQLLHNDNYDFAGMDTVRYKDIYVLYGRDHYLRPSILEEKCYIRPDAPYSASSVDRTYEALGQLGILKFINITMRPIGAIDGTQWLDAYVLMSRNKKQNFSIELEGTNSEGDLGFGVGATYQHRDLAKGSELLTIKLRTSYESLSGNFDGLVNNRYTEYAGEVGITFPKFKAPLLPASFKKRMRSTTEFAVSMNYQERPEYTRVIAGAAWTYKWSRSRIRGFRHRHEFDLIDVNLVKLPKSTLNFLDSIAPSNPLLRYSYEDHFIMRLGYTFTGTNRRIPTGAVNVFNIQPSITSWRLSAEAAGNILYAASKLLHQKRNDDAYKIFGIQYAQYVKAEADFTYVLNFGPRSALAMHIGGGVAVPYLNSSMVPFEKRFYAGGANSVRGWSVRTLGPGCYDSRNSVTGFINQCGDILLNLNVEYRAKLFWVFEGAAFVDAGNIWTIRNYANQPGGLFCLKSFYKEIAGAYGVGLRMDFTYFLLRLDLGIKAHNPAMGQEPWPLLHPNLRRDATLHFAVGYPF